MQKLHLVGFTTDQKGLILSARRGARTGSFHLTVDEELAQSVEELRAKQLEAESERLEEEEAARPARVESALSVREIQARLRQGRSVADVAKAAGVDPEWVERFAPPVFAERAQVIANVQSSPLRRTRLGPSAQPIGESIRRNLADRNVSLTPEEFAEGWSARQLGDGRWAVRFHYRHRGRDNGLRFDLDDATGTIVAADRQSGQLGYITPPTPPSPARPRPAPTASISERGPAKRATVTVGFRPDDAPGHATSRAAKERERANEAMRRAAAKAVVEAERAAARRAKEREAELVRRQREAEAEAASRARERASEEARRVREREAAERAREAAAKKKAAAAQKRADDRAKVKAAKQAAEQARRAEAALREAERRTAAAKKEAAKKVATAKKAPAKKAAATQATAKKAAGRKATPKKVAEASATKTSATKTTATKKPATEPAAATKAPSKKAAPKKAASMKAPVPAKPAAAPEARRSPVVTMAPPRAPRASDPEPPAPRASVFADDDSTGPVRILGPASSSTTPSFRVGTVEAAQTNPRADRLASGAAPSSNGRARERAPGERRTRPLRAT